MLSKQDKIYIENLIDVKLEKKLVPFRNEVMTGLDQVMGELRMIRDEMTLVSYRNSRNAEKIEDHEDRLVVLEGKVGGVLI